MKYKYILFILILLLSASCVSYKNAEDADQVQLITLAGFYSQLNDSVIFKSSRMIALETNEASLIRNIDRLYVSENELFVLDAYLKKVVVFDAKGQYLSHINDVGQGPREYLQLIDMSVDNVNKNILLLCGQPYKLMYYTYAGEFIKEIKLPELYEEIVWDKDYLYCLNSELNKDNDITILSRDGTKIKEALSKGETFNEGNNYTNYVFGKGNCMTKGASCYYTRQFDNVIYQFSEGDILSKYHINFEKHSLPSDLIKTEMPSSEFNKLCNEKRYVCSITNVVENESYLLFNTNIGLFVYDKKADKLNGYRYITNKKVGGGGNNILSVGGSDRKIAEYMQATIFKMIVQKNVELNINSANIDDSFLELVKSMDEEGNPVLFIYEF